MDGELVGGLYGVSLGAAFFGESMFSRVTDASKVALVHLVARLRLGGYRLLDTQFVTPHLAQFGAIEISPRPLSPPACRGAALPRRFLPRDLPAGLSVEAAAERLRRRRRRRALHSSSVDVVDRVLERRQRRARREHPAAEQPLPVPRPAASRRSRERRRSPAGPRARCFSQSRTRIDSVPKRTGAGRPAPRTATPGR